MDQGAWAGHSPLLHVVLHEPEIPNNTGNIGRTCVALHAALHLVEPLGFDLSEKACRRAGLDYWPRLSLHQHASWPGYLGATGEPRRWLLSTRATRSVFDAPFEPGDHLVFGKESRGLPVEIIDANSDRLFRLPMVPGERSLNLASAVCTVMYLAIGRFLEMGRVSRSAVGSLVPAGPTRERA